MKKTEIKRGGDHYCFYCCFLILMPLYRFFFKGNTHTYTFICLFRALLNAWKFKKLTPCPLFQFVSVDTNHRTAVSQSIPIKISWILAQLLLHSSAWSYSVMTFVMVICFQVKALLILSHTTQAAGRMLGHWTSFKQAESCHCDAAPHVLSRTSDSWRILCSQPLRWLRALDASGPDSNFLTPIPCLND